MKPIEALGADFDPHYHQAVSYEPAEDRREGEIIEEFRRGYMLGDRLLRPSMVKVAKGLSGVSKRDYYEVLGVAREATDSRSRARIASSR